MGIVFVFFGVSLIGFSNIDEKKSISNYIKNVDFMNNLKLH